MVCFFYEIDHIILDHNSQIVFIFGPLFSLIISIIGSEVTAECAISLSNSSHPKGIVSKDGGFAAVLLYGSQVAIIPSPSKSRHHHQHEGEGKGGGEGLSQFEEKENENEERKTISLPSSSSSSFSQPFLINLREYGVYGGVVDMAILDKLDEVILTSS